MPLCSGAVLLSVALACAAQARFIPTWTLEKISAEAEVLVVGEVRGVSKVGTIAAEQTPWKTPLLRMSATARVLRTFPDAGASGLKAGDLIVIGYKAVDRERSRGFVNGPMFPTLSPGDIFAFPLRKAASRPDGEWELIHEEDWGLLVPCIEQAPEGAAVESGADFLRAELATALARGRYSDVYRAAYFMQHHRSWPTDSSRHLWRLVEHLVGSDEQQWLDIAVASYCAMGIPRPKIGELRATPEAADERAMPAARALSHVSADGLDDRVITKAIRHCSLHAWGTGATLAINYREHPAAVKLLESGLRAGRPGTIYVAECLIKHNAHPLLPTALDAATRLLQQLASHEHPDFRAACQLVAAHGTEDDFALLVDQIKRAQAADVARCSRLWSSAVYEATRERAMRLCGLVIEDRRVIRADTRLCDSAAARLQYLTSGDFGFRFEKPTAERDEAVEKARAWLAQHAPSALQ